MHALLPLCAGGSGSGRRSLRWMTAWRRRCARSGHLPAPGAACWAQKRLIPPASPPGRPPRCAFLPVFIVLHLSLLSRGPQSLRLGTEALDTSGLWPPAREPQIVSPSVMDCTPISLRGFTGCAHLLRLCISQPASPPDGLMCRRARHGHAGAAALSQP